MSPLIRQTISSGSSWEPSLGYSRAVRVGQHVYVNATAATDAQGHNVGVGDVEVQTRRILEIIEQALEDAGASLADVVKTRMLLVNMDDWETVGHIHGAAFGAIRPASLMCQVARFIDPERLIEIEAEALIDDER
jgi:enamine deaminase RidA (YjgF/YER057c/UK114 family)